jgi:GAF domain-containing protein
LAQYPTHDQWPALTAASDHYRLEGATTGETDWIRLALPLRLKGQVTGVWLLGQRDPDDHYSQPDIAALRAIADQTAITLVHLLQTDQLRGLYQANIARQETERAQLARDLLSRAE